MQWAAVEMSEVRVGSERGVFHCATVFGCGVLVRRVMVGGG